ncbi:MAG: DUF928 domain-containing protein [Cyanobacteria bacterium J06638_28]
MTRPFLKSITNPRVFWRRATAIALVLPLALVVSMPAEAGLLDIFRGRTGSRPTGNSRGGAIRDEACSPEVLEELEEAQLVALVPETLERTTKASPELFVYIPLGQNISSSLVLQFKLKTQLIGLEDVIEPVEFAVPEEPGLVKLTFPTAAPLDIGRTYSWELNLICQNIPTPVNPEATSEAADESAELPSPDVPFDIDNATLDELLSNASADDPNVLNEELRVAEASVYGDIERVAVTAALAQSLANKTPAMRYEAYLEQKIWFDMVSALAASRSTTWTALLDEFDLENIDPAPQTMTLSTHSRED